MPVPLVPIIATAARRFIWTLGRKALKQAVKWAWKKAKDIAKKRSLKNAAKKRLKRIRKAGKGKAKKTPKQKRIERKKRRDKARADRKAAKEKSKKARKEARKRRRIARKQRNKIKKQGKKAKGSKLGMGALMMAGALSSLFAADKSPREEKRLENAENNAGRMSDDQSQAVVSAIGGMSDDIANLKKAMVPLHVDNITVSQVISGNSKKDVRFAQRMTEKNTTLLQKLEKSVDIIAKNAVKMSKKNQGAILKAQMKKKPKTTKKVIQKNIKKQKVKKKKTMMDKIKDWLTAFISKNFIWIIGIVGVLMGLWYIIDKYWDSIMNFLEPVWAWAQDLWTDIGLAWDNFAEWFGNSWDAVSDWIADTWDGFAAWAGPLWDEFTDWASDLWGSFICMVAQALQKLDDILESIEKFFQKIWDWVVDQFKKIGEYFASISEFVSNMFKKAQKLYDKIVGVWDDIVNSDAGKWIADKWGKLWGEEEKDENGQTKSESELKKTLQKLIEQMIHIANQIVKYKKKIAAKRVV